MDTDVRSSSEVDAPGARTSPTMGPTGPGSMSGSQLPPLERDVLDEVCQSRVTRSVVTLAADLYERGRIDRLGDPVGLITWTLESLNQRGLVTYKSGSRYDVSALEGMPLDIRATPEGYAAVGYTLRARLIQYGRHRKDDASAPGDRTDFRNHEVWAQGGPIERLTITEHCLVYSDHADIHSEQLAEWRAGREHKVASKITPEVEADIIALRKRGLNPRQISESLDRVGVYITDEGIRQRLNALGIGPSQTATPSATLHARTNGSAATDAERVTDRATASPASEATSDMPAQQSSATDALSAFPMLRDLIARDRMDGDTRAKVALLLESASALETVDLQAAVALRDRALYIERTSLTPLDDVSAEYLAYWRSKEG